MLFALNYSLAAAKLLKGGRIKIDLFKLPDWEWAVREALLEAPTYVHFRLQAGQRPAVKPDLEGIEKFLATTDTACVNTHFMVNAAQTGEPPDVDVAVEAACEDLRALGARFGIERIIVENIPWVPWAPHVSTVVSSTDAISRVIRQSGAGLLLDIAHARLAAEDQGVPVQEYIMALPVDRVRELHVTGIGPRPEGGRIDHKPMTDEDWKLFEWTMAQIKSGVISTPDIVSCEYGGIGEPHASNTSEEVLLEQIPRMYEVVKE